MGSFSHHRHLGVLFRSNSDPLESFIFLCQFLWRHCKRAVVELVCALNADKQCFSFACILKCKSDIKCRSSPLPLLPSQFLGMRSLIRYDLETTDIADTFCSAVLVLFHMSILPLTVSFISFLKCCITSVMSCLNCC